MLNIATPRILHLPEQTTAPSSHGPWVWPLPRLDGLAPCIFASTKDAPPDSIELGYRERSSSPDFVPVFAARDGVIAYAGTASGSPTICLDHAGGWSTQYAELEHVLATPTDRFRRRRKVRVRAGDVLGHARRSSLRVRFGLGRLTDGAWTAIDPEEEMHTWSLLPWFSDPTPSLAAQRAA